MRTHFRTLACHVALWLGLLALGPKEHHKLTFLLAKYDMYRTRLLLGIDSIVPKNKELK